MERPILVISTLAPEMVAWLAERLPGERFRIVDCPGQVGPLLSGLPPDERPNIVLGMNSPHLPRSDMHLVRDLETVRWWQVAGSGYEWLGDWDRQRLTVTNCVGVLAPFLAETAIGAMIALNNGLLAYREKQRARRWAPVDFPPLSGQRLLVVGAGAIGQKVAQRARAFGLHTTGLSRDGAAREPFDEVVPLAALDRALGQADIVSCHLRLTPATRGIFDGRRFGLMKPGALFLNSARGGHVDEAALLAALTSGHLRGAWLDVFETEPLPEESPLWDAPNLLITPHASDQIEGWHLRFAALFAENVERWRAGQPLINRVP
ncbi:MAG: D-2-hydroxyacid dehydrogenase [Pseudomonadota bacterium]